MPFKSDRQRKYMWARGLAGKNPHKDALDAVLKEKTAGLNDIDHEQFLKMYDLHDPAHNRGHALAVKNRAQELSSALQGDHLDLTELSAILHDIGISQGREEHEAHGGRLVRSNQHLIENLTKEQLEAVAHAVEQHRASTGHPETLLAKIISDADRLSTDNPVRRAYLYGIEHEPGKTDDYYVQRADDHIVKKYGPGGTGRRLYLPESEKILDTIMHPVMEAHGSGSLEELRKIIHAGAVKKASIKFADMGMTPGMLDVAGPALHDMAKDTAKHLNWNNEGSMLFDTADTAKGTIKGLLGHVPGLGLGNTAAPQGPFGLKPGDQTLSRAGQAANTGVKFLARQALTPIPWAMDLAHQAGTRGVGLLRKILGRR